MLIYEFLMNDHRLVLDALDSLQKAEDKEQCENIMNFISHELIVHSKAEEEVLYRPLSEAIGKNNLIEHSFDEHKDIEYLLMDIKTTSTGSTRWINKVMELRSIIEDHIQTEETELFHIAQEIFSEREAEYITLRMMEEKGKLGMENPIAMFGHKMKEVAQRFVM